MDIILETRLDEVLLKNCSEHIVAELKKELEDSIDPSEVDKHADIIKSIDAFGFKQMKKDLKSIHNKHYGNEADVNKQGKRKILFWIIGAIAGLLLLGLYLINNPITSKSPNELYVEYHEPFDYNVGLRNANQKTLFELGILYEEKNYQEFLSQYEMHHKDNDELKSDFILAVGFVYTETNQPYKGIYQFNKIIENQDLNYITAARWYKAMALLKANELSTCEEVLGVISENADSEYVAKSQKLLKEINQLKK